MLKHQLFKHHLHYRVAQWTTDTVAAGKFTAFCSSWTSILLALSSAPIYAARVLTNAMLDRSPDRGTYGRGPPPPPTDSYVPGGRRRSRSPEFYRRRSRSPPRMQSDTWTPRARSPPRRFDPRDDYPPRDARPRSPRRGYPPAGDRYDPRTRSPQPPINRVRDFSPPNTRMRSPPPTRSDRVASPSRDYGRPRR